MSDVFYLRRVDPPANLDDLPTMAAQAQGCFGLHRVDWRMSFLAADGSEMLCWYRAPDAESARIALRQLGADMSGVWPGRPEPRSSDHSDAMLATASVLAAVPAGLTETMQQEVIGAIESAGGELLCRFSALDGQRSIWLLRSVENPEVSAAFGAASVPHVRIWACNAFVPGSAANQD